MPTITEPVKHTLDNVRVRTLIEEALSEQRRAHPKWKMTEEWTSDQLCRVVIKITPNTPIQVNVTLYQGIASISVTYPAGIGLIGGTALVKKYVDNIRAEVLRRLRAAGSTL